MGQLQNASKLKFKKTCLLCPRRLKLLQYRKVVFVPFPTSLMVKTLPSAVKLHVSPVFKTTHHNSRL